MYQSQAAISWKHIIISSCKILILLIPMHIWYTKDWIFAANEDTTYRYPINIWPVNIDLTTKWMKPTSISENGPSFLHAFPFSFFLCNISTTNEIIGWFAGSRMQIVWLLSVLVCSRNKHPAKQLFVEIKFRKQFQSLIERIFFPVFCVLFRCIAHTLTHTKISHYI